MRSYFGLGSESANQLFIGRIGDHAAKLRTEVIHHADIFGDHVIDAPFTAEEMGFVVDRKLLAFAGENFAGDFRENAVELFTDINDLFVGIGLNGFGVGAFQKVGKKMDELLLLRRGAPAPVGSEGAFGHLVEIETGKENLFELVSALFG